jgi:hypothetical protein
MREVVLPQEKESMFMYKCANANLPRLHSMVVPKSLKKCSHFTDTIWELLQMRVFTNRYMRKLGPSIANPRTYPETFH